MAEEIIKISGLTPRIAPQGTEEFPFRDGQYNGSLNLSQFQFIYDVSKSFPDQSPEGNDVYTLQQAIALIPQAFRNQGIVASFIDAEGVKRYYQWNGINYSETENWTELGYSQIQSILNQIEELNKLLYLSADVPTFSEEPNSNTLTWIFSHDGQSTTVNFKIGDMCRVPNSQSEYGYDFYMLYNIIDSGTSKQAVWGPISAAGGSNREKATIRLIPNHEELADALKGAVFIVAIGDDEPLRYTWQGEPFTVNVPLGQSYTVTCQPFANFKVPEPQEFQAYLIVRNIDLTYEATIVSLDVTSNNPDINLDNVQATLSATAEQITNGVVVTRTGTSFVAKDAQIYLFSATNIQDYNLVAEPAIGSLIDTSQDTCVISLSYTTGEVSFNATYNQSTGELFAPTVTLSWVGGQVLIPNGQSAFVPLNTTIHVSCSEVANYRTPTYEDFVSSSAGGEISVEYVTRKVTFQPTSNQSAADLSSAVLQVTYNNTQTRNIKYGQHSFFADGLSLTYNYQPIKISSTNFNAFKSPDSVTSTITQDYVATGQYLAEALTVSVENADSVPVINVEDLVGNVLYSNTVLTNVYLPYDETYVIKGQVITGQVPSEYPEYVASQVTREVTITYTEGGISVVTINQNIQDSSAMVNVDDDTAINYIFSNSHAYLCKYMGEDPDTHLGRLTICQLSDSTYQQYHDGSASVLTGAEGDVMVKPAKFYYHCEETETGSDIWKLTIAYGIKPSDDFIEYEGNTMIGVYPTTDLSSGFNSWSGGTLTETVTDNESFHTEASNKGTGFSPETYELCNILNFLFLAKYKNTNAQAVLGTGADKYAGTLGVHDSTGFSDTVNNTDSVVKYFGLEAYYVTFFNEYVSGLDVNSTTNFVVSTLDGGTRNVSIAYNGYGYSSRMIIGDHVDLIQKQSTGTSTTGYCDFQNVNGATGYSIVRGCRNSGQAYSDAIEQSSYGLFASDSFVPAADSYISSRLQFTGQITIEEDPEVFKTLIGSVPAETLTLNFNPDTNALTVTSDAQYNVVNALTSNVKIWAMRRDYTGTRYVTRMNNTNPRQYYGTEETIASNIGASIWVQFPDFWFNVIGAYNNWNIEFEVNEADVTSTPEKNWIKWPTDLLVARYLSSSAGISFFDGAANSPVHTTEFTKETNTGIRRMAYAEHLVFRYLFGLINGPSWATAAASHNTDGPITTGSTDSSNFGFCYLEDLFVTQQVYDSNSSVLSLNGTTIQLDFNKINSTETVDSVAVEVANSSYSSVEIANGITIQEGIIMATGDVDAQAPLESFIITGYPLNNDFKIPAVINRESQKSLFGYSFDTDYDFSRYVCNFEVTECDINTFKQLPSNGVSPEAASNGVYIFRSDGLLYTTTQWQSFSFDKSSAVGVAVVSDNAKVVLAPSRSASDTGSSYGPNSLVAGVVTTTDLEIAKKDYSGYVNSVALQNASNDCSAVAALNYTSSVYQTLERNWHLASVGEANEIVTNFEALKEALALIEGTYFNGDNNFALSTQYDATNFYYLKYVNDSSSVSITHGQKSGNNFYAFIMSDLINPVGVKPDMVGNGAYILSNEYLCYTPTQWQNSNKDVSQAYGVFVKKDNYSAVISKTILTNSSGGFIWASAYNDELQREIGSDLLISQLLCGEANTVIGAAEQMTYSSSAYGEAYLHSENNQLLWYLPAAGEFNEVISELDTSLNEAFNALGITLDYNPVWTSTQFDATNAVKVERASWSASSEVKTDLRPAWPFSNLLSAINGIDIDAAPNGVYLLCSDNKLYTPLNYKKNNRTNAVGVVFKNDYQSRVVALETVASGNWSESDTPTEGMAVYTSVDQTPECGLSDSLLAALNTYSISASNSALSKNEGNLRWYLPSAKEWAHIFDAVEVNKVMEAAYLAWYSGPYPTYIREGINYWTSSQAQDGTKAFYYEIGDTHTMPSALKSRDGQVVMPFALLPTGANSTFFTDVEDGTYLFHVTGNCYSIEDWAKTSYSNKEIVAILVKSGTHTVLVNIKDLDDLYASPAVAADTLIEGIVSDTTSEGTTALTDFEGYENTQKVLAITGEEQNAFSNSVASREGGLEWYVPALGELALLKLNTDYLKSSLLARGFYSKSSYLSSTQGGATEFWAQYIIDNEGQIYKAVRNTDLVLNVPFAVLPTLDPLTINSLWNGCFLINLTDKQFYTFPGLFNSKGSSSLNAINFYKEGDKYYTFTNWSTIAPYSNILASISIQGIPTVTEVGQVTEDMNGLLYTDIILSLTGNEDNAFYRSRSDSRLTDFLAYIASINEIKVIVDQYDYFLNSSIRFLRDKSHKEVENYASSNQGSASNVAYYSNSVVEISVAKNQNFNYFYSVIINNITEPQTLAQLSQTKNYGAYIYYNDGKCYTKSLWKAETMTASNVIGYVVYSPYKSFIVRKEGLSLNSWGSASNPDSVVVNTDRITATYDLSGESNTKAFINSNYSVGSAFELVNELQDGGLNWYLPSLGELGVFYAYRNYIQQLIDTISDDSDIISNTANNYLASTIYDVNNCWILQNSNGLGLKSLKNNENNMVFPFASFYQVGSTTAPQGVSIFCIDGKYYTKDEWVLTKNSSSSAVGVAINDGTNKLIFATQVLSNQYQWSSSTSTISGATSESDQATALTDLAGNSNTAHIIGVTNIASNAAFNCSRYNKGNLNWYLPSLGQLNILAQNRTAYNEIITLLGLSGFSSNVLSSTQVNAAQAWLSNASGSVTTNTKTASFSVLPVADVPEVNGVAKEDAPYGVYLFNTESNLAYDYWNKEDGASYCYLVKSVDSAGNDSYNLAHYKPELLPFSVQFASTNPTGVLVRTQSAALSNNEGLLNTDIYASLSYGESSSVVQAKNVSAFRFYVPSLGEAQIFIPYANLLNVYGRIWANSNYLFSSQSLTSSAQSASAVFTYDSQAISYSYNAKQGSNTLPTSYIAKLQPKQTAPYTLENIPYGVFVLYNNEFYSLDYWKEQSGLTAQGIAVNSPYTQFVINISSSTKSYSTTTTSISGPTTTTDELTACYDLRGNANSSSIIAATSGQDNAANYCNSIADIGDRSFFLPSIGQLRVMMVYKAVVDHFAEELSLTLPTTGNFISSTQYDASNCWVLNYETGEVSQQAKTTVGNVIAFANFTLELGIIPSTAANGIYVYRSNYLVYAPDDWDTANNAEAVGIAVITDDYKIIVAKNNAGSSSISNRTSITGATLTTSAATAQQDLAGYSNTEAYREVYSGNDAYGIAVNYNDGTTAEISWFLPSAGMMNMVGDNLTQVNGLLSIIGGDQILSNVWSSTQYSASNNYVVNTAGTASSASRVNSNNIRPVALLRDEQQQTIPGLQITRVTGLPTTTGTYTLSFENESGTSLGSIPCEIYPRVNVIYIQDVNQINIWFNSYSTLIYTLMRNGSSTGIVGVLTDPA